MGPRLELLKNERGYKLTNQEWLVYKKNGTKSIYKFGMYFRRIYKKGDRLK